MKTPNILFILADDHGYGDISAHDGPNIQTPNIDRICLEGIRFTQFYANSTVCSPSRAALMTGRYPDLVGVPGVIRQVRDNSWGYFDPTAITLPQMLKRAGYHTAHFGKWHLGLEDENHPCERGFDQFQGFIDDMMDDYHTHRRFDKNGMRHNKAEIDPEGHATDLFTNWTIDYLRERSGSEQPFFCYLAYNAPHTPIQPPDEWYEKVRSREPAINEKRARYVALVEHMDNGIGKVLNALDELQLTRDTLVVYTSDNGGCLEVGAYNGTLRGGKQDWYEGGIRVPCCIRWPDYVQPKRMSNQIAMLMDFFPTFCDIADIEINHEIDGRSILPLLNKDDIDVSDRWLYWIRREGGGNFDRNQLFFGNDYHAVRHGALKLLHNTPFAPMEIFDLESDPFEESPLDSKRLAEQSDMLKFMQRQILRAGGVPWRKE